MTSPTKGFGNNTPPPLNDRADISKFLQTDPHSQVECTPPPTTASNTRLVTSASNKQRLEDFLPSSEHLKDDSESHPPTSSLDNCTGSLTFDDPLMAEENSSWVVEGIPQQYQRIGDIFAHCAETREWQARNKETNNQEESCFAIYPKPEVTAQDTRFRRTDLLAWERLHEFSSKSTSCTDLSSSTINSRPLSPIALNNVSPTRSRDSVYNTYEIHRNGSGGRTTSPYQFGQRDLSSSIPDRAQFVETPPLIDLRLNTAHKSTHCLLQTQFEIYSSSAEFMSLEATSNYYESPDTLSRSQSQSIGTFFSAVEKFISIISEPQIIISGNSSPQMFAQCPSASSLDTKTTMLESPEHFHSFPPTQLAQPTSTINAKILRSSSDLCEPDLGAFHLVLACHTRLMAAYEAIIDKIAFQYRSIDSRNVGVSPVAGLSGDGFMVRCDISLESHLHLQIIVHQLERLSEACYGYLTRTSSTSACEDVLYFNSSPGLHENCRRAAPAAFVEMAKSMVADRETTLREKIGILARGPQHALAVDPFHFQAHDP
ncbi:MAG: hypothetical protein Q9191_002760 [Dirinaria sp. TL-2023a]